MLTLNTSAKSGLEAVEIVRSSIKNNNYGDIKISIDGPEQFEDLRKFLVSEGGFTDVTLEDDEGMLYIIASGRQINNEPEKILLAPIDSESEQKTGIQNEQELTPQEPKKIFIPVKNSVIRDSLAVILSYENKKYRSGFMKKFVRALGDSKIQPSVIALMDNAVSLAAYDSETCEILKALEESGAEILVSDSCSDRLGLTEALGTGKLSDMSEILEKIFECEKVVSL